MDAILLINQKLYLSIYGLSGKNPLLDNLMVFGAKYLIFIMIFLSLFLLLKKNTKNLKIFLLTLLSIIVGFILFKIVNLIIFETRPYLEFGLKSLLSDPPTSSAFPSRHTFTLALITFPYFFYKHKLAGIFLIALIWVGFSRIFVGVHYPLDILGAIILGFLAVFLSWWVKIKLIRVI